jgi:hypothetical protein
VAHYDDLAPCDYFPGLLSVGSLLLAVGWLEPGYPYATGDPGREVYERLRLFCWSHSWQPVSFFGSHACDLGACRYGSFHSHRNIFIPGPGVVYVAPEGILHYISCHDYLPPASFCAAVLASPEEDSPEYFAALRASGFRNANPDEPKAIRRGGIVAIVEARGRALVEAIEIFRRMQGHWPRTLDEAIGLVDDAGTWQYAVEKDGFTLEADWRAREAFAVRYESRHGVWGLDHGPAS